mgnify:CR=1 FL=1
MSADNQCRRCRIQGQPAIFASSVQCAFPSGVFSADNWQCATLTRLRSLLPDSAVQFNWDVSAALIRCYGADEGFLVISWYKSRGHTSAVTWICEDESRPAKWDEVEATINGLERERREADRG